MRESLPAIGTNFFKELPYQSQLYILSLKLFSPEEYSVKTGEKSSSGPSTLLPGLDINYPPESPHTIKDLPIAFLRDCWAGYNCKFSEKWYQFKGLHRLTTPLDEFGIEHRYIVNLNSFNFPFISVQPAVNSILTWVSNNIHRGFINNEVLIDTCKVYNFLYMKGMDLDYSNVKSGFAASVYKNSLKEFHTCLLFEDINNVNPVIENCDELDYIEFEDFLILKKSKQKFGRFHYPLIPKGLFSTHRFSISNWGWLDKSK